jgi:MFS family permease
MLPTNSRSIWHHPEFLKLWAGQTISVFGSGVKTTVLPLTAVLLLGASASDMGWLLAVESAPVLLVGLVAGVWLDRVRGRPVLISADLGRAGPLACIPLLAALGGLRMEHLFAVGSHHRRPGRPVRGRLPIVRARPGRPRGCPGGQ